MQDKKIFFNAVNTLKILKVAINLAFLFYIDFRMQTFDFKMHL